ncbi:MAG TPA: mandelate racemase/muconate lactonizing enzyme family protein [Roseiflexaceae bacterium]|nr:mandelate racemase/muconate lactonizing enzyme family protein [Roseiflexaceae bacterium]
MRITDVEVIPLRIPDHNVHIADGIQDDVIVRIHTDEGITGVGEADSSPMVVKAVVEAWPSWPRCRGLKDILVGEDPLNIEMLWEKMRFGTLWLGRNGVAQQAIAAVDIALWDLAGKALGKPVHALLGGAYRDRVRVYASALFTEDPGEMTEVGQRYAAEGFAAVKFGWGPMGRSLDGDVRLVETARRAIGDAPELLIDAGCPFKAREAIQRARAFAPYRPFWLEEALEGDDLDGYRQLSRAAGDIHIATGEQESALAAFESLITHGEVDIVQPDISRAGGITECRRIAAMAARHGRLCVFHAWKSGILVAATLHMAATVPDLPFAAYTVSESPLRRELVHSTVELHDGIALIPQGPGLGVELDEAILEKYRTDR